MSALVGTLKFGICSQSFYLGLGQKLLIFDFLECGGGAEILSL